MSCSSEPRVFQVAYSSDTPQFWYHHACYTVFKLEKSLKHCNHFGSCLLWVMSTEISVDIAVDIAVDTRSIVGRHSVDSRSILGRHSVDSRSTLGRQSVDIAVDSRSIVGRHSVETRPIVVPDVSRPI